MGPAIGLKGAHGQSIFSNDTEKMEDAINVSEICSGDVDDASRQLVQVDRQCSALSIMDCNW